MITPQEELTRRFYAWERRGRGWLQWSERVALEPPFVPFPGHFLLAPARVIDDARRESFTSRLLRWFGAPEGSEAGEEPGDILPEPEPVFVEAAEDIVEFAIALPEGTKVDHDAAEALLLTLGTASAPVAFEIIGDAGRIVMQIATPATEKAHVEEILRSFFPAATVAERRDYLATEWRTAGNRIAIVECALAREFTLPLRTFGRADPDPLITIIAALGTLEPGDLGMLQVLFQRTRHDWSGSTVRALTDASGAPFFDDAPELTRIGLEKVSFPLFSVLVRIAAASPESGRATAIANRIGAGLTAFGRTDGNELVFIGNDEGVDLESDLVTRSTHRSGMLLSADELVALVHPPSASVASPKLVRRVRRTKPAPPGSIGQPITLGENEHAGRVLSVGLSPDERMRHLHVVGASGTGKSTFLLNLVLQSIALGRGVGVLDPHGDLVDEVLARIPESREQDVVLVDASDAEYPVAFNLLDAHSDLERTLLASDLVGVFRRLSTTWGDQMQAVLANAIQAFLTSTRGGSLSDLRRFLIEQDYRRDFLSTVEDEEIVYYWTKEFPLLVGKPAGPILTRLDSFLRPRPLRAMLAQRKSRLDFREILDGSRIFLAKLAQGAIGEENAALLGSLFVAKFHQAAISRQEVMRDARKDFDLVIDEFQDLVTPSVANILAGTRKYRLGLTAAHQSLRPVYEADAAVAASLMANAATRVVFRVGDDDARKLADGFASFDAQALTTLGVGEAICRIDRADHDFNLKVRMPEPVEATLRAERRSRAIAVSRERYGVPLASGAERREGVTRDAVTAEHETPKAATKRPTRLKDFLDDIEKGR